MEPIPIFDPVISARHQSIHHQCQPVHHTTVLKQLKNNTKKRRRQTEEALPTTHTNKVR